MGGAAKAVANVATLGLAGKVLGDSFETPKTDTTTAQDVDTNDVSNADADSFAADKRRRAKAGGISSTILGGASAAAAPTATKTLLGQ